MKASEKWQGFNVMIYKVKMRYKVDLDNKKLLSFLYLSFLQQHDHTLYKKLFYAKSSFKDAIPWKQVAISIYQTNTFVIVLVLKKCNIQSKLFNP